jgi:hypothetical protein
MRTHIKRSVIYLPRPVVVLLLLAFCCTLDAQIMPATPSNVDHVRLELAATRVQTESGERDGLTIRFINDGDDSVSLPKPTRFCGDSRDGFVMVYSKALHPPEGRPLGGTGCVVDKVARGDILVEAAQWVTIPPGAIYELIEPLSKAIDTRYGDSYEITARYYPAYASPSDKGRLQENGIHLVQAILNSEPLVVQTNPSD